jgi:hypothetical protein
VNASALLRFDGHEKIEIVIIAIRLTLETHKVEIRTHGSANEPPNHDEQDGGSKRNHDQRDLLIGACARSPVTAWNSAINTASY